MPYALMNPKDGETVSYRTIEDEAEATAVEVVVEEAPDGKVWDSATASLRLRTGAESLEEAKAAKEAALRDQADSWYQANVRSFEGAVVTAKYGRGGLAALSAEERSVFDAMNQNYERLRTLVGQARAASSEEELEGISWTA
jgi:hypothetical protein